MEKILLRFPGPAGNIPSCSMSLTAEQIERLARLARLAITAEEREAVRGDLNRILGLIDEMRAVDTAGVEPMAHAVAGGGGAGQRLREDRVTEPDRRAEFLAVAPAVEDGLYLVPRVVE